MISSEDLRMFADRADEVRQKYSKRAKNTCETLAHQLRAAATAIVERTKMINDLRKRIAEAEWLLHEYDTAEIPALIQEREALRDQVRALTVGGANLRRLLVEAEKETADGP